MSRQCERLRQEDDDVANLLAVVDVKTPLRRLDLVETVAIRGWAAGDQTTLRLLVPWSWICGRGKQRNNRQTDVCGAGRAKRHQIDNSFVDTGPRAVCTWGGRGTRQGTYKCMLPRRTWWCLHGCHPKTRGSARSAAAEQNLHGWRQFFGSPSTRALDGCRGGQIRHRKKKRPRPGVRLSDRVLLKRLAPSPISFCSALPLLEPSGDFGWRRNQKNKDLAASHRRGCHGGGGGQRRRAL